MPCAQVQGYPVSRSVLAQKLRIIGPGLDLLSALVMIPAALKPVVFGDALPSECRHGAAYDLRLCQHGIARKRALAGQDREILRQVAYDGAGFAHRRLQPIRSEEHTSELQSLMRISYAVFRLKKKKHKN